MKKFIFVIALVLTAFTNSAQNTYNLVLFSEDGEPFFAYVNGIRQNDKPETNIKVTQLTSEALSIRVQFENAALPVLKQNMMPEPGFEHTVKIKKNVKKVMKMQYFGKVALNEAPRTNAATVQYHTAENPVEAVNTQPAVAVMEEQGSNTTITTTSITSNTAITPNATSVNMNVGGIGINMNVTGTESTYSNTGGVNSSTFTSSSSTVATHQPQKTSVSSTTYITTSSSATHQPRSSHVNKDLSAVSNTGAGTTSSVIPRPMNPALTSTAANTGCGAPMADADYEKLKASIDEKPFEDNKMSIAKVGTKSNCLTVAQIKGICELFAMDDHKVAYAKYAYAYCTDKGNYFQVNDVFTFPRTTEDLNKFLSQQH